jgi:hypothetical protein
MVTAGRLEVICRRGERFDKDLRQLQAKQAQNRCKALAGRRDLGRLALGKCAVLRAKYAKNEAGGDLSRRAQAE